MEASDLCNHVFDPARIIWINGTTGQSLWILWHFEHKRFADAALDIGGITMLAIPYSNIDRIAMVPGSLYFLEMQIW